MECKGPEMRSYRIWPIVLCQKEHTSSTISEITNSSFGNAVLVVCIDTAETIRLTSGSPCRPEVVVGKDTVVAMIVANSDMVTSGEVLESQFPI